MYGFVNIGENKKQNKRVITCILQISILELQIHDKGKDRERCGISKTKQCGKQDKSQDSKL